MQKYLSILFAALTLSFAPLASHAALPGQPCNAAQLGTTMMADDNKNIIACLETNKTPRNYIWKSMTSEFTDAKITTDTIDTKVTTDTINSKVTTDAKSQDIQCDTGYAGQMSMTCVNINTGKLCHLDVNDKQGWGCSDISGFDIGSGDIRCASGYLGSMTCVNLTLGNSCYGAYSGDNPSGSWWCYKHQNFNIVNID